MKRLENAVISEVVSLFAVYSRRGRDETMTNRICYGLSFCESGKITYLQDGNEYVSDPRHAVILPKGGNYRIRGDETGFFPVVNFECAAPLADTVTVLPVRDPAPLVKQFLELERVSMFGQNKLKERRILYQMLEYLLEEAELQNPVLRPALELLENGYMHPQLGNADLAHVCGLSEVYFRKLFTEEFHVTPHRYLVGLRIQKAQQLLREGGFRVAQVAERCGFSNEYHFSRAFKRLTGMTPSEYARKQKYSLQG